MIVLDPEVIDLDGAFKQFVLDLFKATALSTQMDWSMRREHPAQSFYPGWLGEENSAEDCCTIKVKPEYREDFAAFLLWLLQSSPIKQILFLCVGEMWPAPRTPIIGTLPFRSFSEQIASVGVLSDVCYYICL